MKNIYNFILEKLVLNKDTKIIKYKYYPQTREELRWIIEERLADDLNADLNDIDVSKITDMSYLFDGLDPHDIDISEWDVSNVENMYHMFWCCKNFNSNLSKWVVLNVENMIGMFWCCENFNSDLNSWDVSNVKSTYAMFFNCISMKEPPKWYKKN